MHSDPKGTEVAEARRRFLAKCGQFAAATPPAISLLLAASRSNYAVAASGGSTSGGGGGGITLAGGPNGPVTTSSVNTGTTLPTDPGISNNNPTGGTTAGRSCGNMFDSLFNSDKCIR